MNAVVLSPINKKGFFWWAIFLLWTLTCHWISITDAATTEQEVKSKLTSAQNEIRQVQKKRDDTEGNLGKLHNQLAETELAIGRVNKKLLSLKTARKRLSLERQELQIKQDGLRLKLKTQQSKLANLVRAEYISGHNQGLKLLLNQQDPATFSRKLVYFNYFNKARINHIHRFKEMLVKVTEVGNEIANNAKTLDNLEWQFQAEKEAIETSRAKRQLALDAVNNELNRHNQTLSELQTHEHELQNLLQSLWQVLTEVSQEVDKHKSFKAMKGRLPWPVHGQITSSFGAKQSTGRSHQKSLGVLIHAKANMAVYTISHGRVVFADWMRGYGLLVIIEHGNRYMSLYGYNQSLYKTPGDWVEAGEMIARVGNSGGQEAAGLYFELRHDSVPIDPSVWCSSKEKAKTATLNEGN